MIAKVTRGRGMGRLVRYLFSEAGERGLHNEHVDCRVVAADGVLGVADGLRPSKAEVAGLARAMEAPAALYGAEVAAGEVWHVSLSTRGGVDRDLSDGEWHQVAVEAMERLGFTGTGGRAACRWLAVRHGRSGAGNDHLHIAVSLVREDGTVASTSNDYRKLSALCRDMEARFGLSVVEGRVTRAGMRGVTRAEAEKAARAGHDAPERVELARAVRAAATASVGEAEFVRRLRAAGLAVRPRLDRSGGHRVVGYSVAGEPSDGGVTVFFGGGKLARDLALPALRARWDDTEEARQEAVAEWAGAEPAGPAGGHDGGRTRGYEWRDAAARWGRQERPDTPGGARRETTPVGAGEWGEAVARIGSAVDALAELPAGDRDAWRAVGADAAGIAASLAARVGPAGGELAAAADVLARSAQGPGRVTSSPSRVSATLRAVAAVATQAKLAEDTLLAWQLLLAELLRLARAIHEAHLARNEATQAARLAGEARLALEAAHARFGDAETLRAALPQLLEAAAAEAERDDAEAGEDDRRRRRRRSGAVRPEDVALIAGRSSRPAAERDKSR